MKIPRRLRRRVAEAERTPRTVSPRAVEPASPLGGDAWLKVVEPCLSQTLVDEAGKAFLVSVARRLPGSGIHVVEVRLSDAARKVDLSIGVVRPETGLALAHKPFPAHLRAFLTRWSEGVAELGPVAAVWLEFDQGEDDAALPTPVVCARIRDG